MKTLLILRHAKSSWAEPTLADHDRPLNHRGRRDAPRMGRLIKHEGLVPDLIVSSTALRAHTTATEVANACGYGGEIEQTEFLYHAYPDDYIQFLCGVPDEHDSVMVVGHNPCLEDLVEALSGEHQTMPTATLAHLVLEIDCWSELTLRVSGRLRNIWRPKETFER
jgi:phosphohistidine phosphatase